MPCHRTLKSGRYKRLDQGGAASIRFCHDALIKEGPDAVPGHQGPNLVAAQQLHSTVRITHCHAHPIAVRVSPDDRLRAHFLRQLDRLMQGRGVLRIRRVNGRESPVLLILLLYRYDFKSEFPQHGNHDPATRSVQVGIDHPG